MAVVLPRVHAQAAGEEEDPSLLAYGDQSTVSIATGSEQSLRRAPAVATVITAQDIAAMGATDLDEVLESVPGLHVSRNVQGYNPLYVIRGIYSEFNPQTLVLQNGVPMTMLFIGNRGNGWAGLPLENVARIEVIRGPGSALYGADAYSGVINIITKSAADVAGAEFGVRRRFVPDQRCLGLVRWQAGAAERGGLPQGGFDRWLQRDDRCGCSVHPGRRVPRRRILGPCSKPGAGPGEHRP